MLNAPKSYLAFMCLIVSSMVAVTVRADEPSLMSPEALWKLGRIGEAAVSPDGDRVAFTVTRYNLAANEGKTDLVVGSLPNPDAAGDQTAVAFNTPLVEMKKQRVIVKGAKGLGSVQWLRRGDSLSIVYIAPGAEEPNDAQIWSIPPEGGEPKQLTKVAGGVGNLKASPTGAHLAFTVDVKLDPTPQEIYPDLPKADARIIDSLMYRHWNAWHDYAYSHVHVAKIQDDGSLGEPVDLMAGLKFDCPLPPMGGADEFNFSPDGDELALTIKAVNNPAESTDSSVMLVSLEGGPMNNITVGMNGYDKNPVYSPDGRYIAFQSMERPGFEADRNRIMLYDRTNGYIEEITEQLDQSAHNVRWNAGSDTLFFDSEYSGTQQVYSMAIHTRQVQQITSGTFNFQVVDSIPNSQIVLLTQQNMLRPAELAAVDIETRKTTTLTSTNEKLFANLELPKVEERWVRATDGAHIHNWVILPPNFDPAKKYPSLVFCQGGPQAQVSQAFSYRWNFHLMAAKGYVVLGVNRRGLPGFGQAWNDEISGDWGGQAMQDILAATDALLTEPYIDSKRVGAVGASFGGYTVYWLMGNAQDRFQAMIAHCGVFNLESMSGSTEELFFTNFDLGGPYWKSDETQEKYDAFSPHRFVGNWRTPLLVIHGEKDFRVPVTQGMEAFTAAQVQGVPSRFLYFPGEGHWVSKPQNSVLWQRVFFDWLETHLK
jgi:dipeptidyl aminopeptidase/acylaminoacyl peptidase